jgi:hypothetical protein
MNQLPQRFIFFFLILLMFFVFGIASQALSNPDTDSQSKATFYVD